MVAFISIRCLVRWIFLYQSRLSFSFSIPLLIFLVLLKTRILNFSMYSIPCISTDPEDFRE